MELILPPVFVAFAILFTQLLLSAGKRHAAVGPHWHSVELYSRKAAPVRVPVEAHEPEQAGYAELNALIDELAGIEARVHNLRAQVSREKASIVGASEQRAA